MSVCGFCGLDVLPGGNHEAVNHPGGAATPFDWRPAYWRDENLRRDASRRAKAGTVAVEAPPTSEVVKPEPLPVTGYKPTSYAAWIASLPNLRETERVILGLFHERGPMTDEQLYDAFTVDRPAAYRNTVLPTRTGLYKTGYVVDTGRKAKVRSGRTAIVWGLPL